MFRKSTIIAAIWAIAFAQLVNRWMSDRF